MTLLHFCVVYIHETLHFYVFHRTEIGMILWYYHILELTNIFADDIDIQGDSLQEFIGYYQVEE